MTKNEIIEYLNKISSDKFKNNVVKMGIPEENSIGVSTGDIRKLAKNLEYLKHCLMSYGKQDTMKQNYFPS